MAPESSDGLFVIIDVTTLRDTHIVCICNLTKTSKFWETMKAQGRKLIGPQLGMFESGLWKSGSGLDTEQLRALYKNETGKEPPSDKAQLAEAVSGVVERHPIDNSLDTLPKVVTFRNKRSAPAEGGSISRPKSGVTAQVWEIADKAVSDAGFGSGRDRAEIIALCVEAGINPATASTQYCKWNKARRASK